MQNLKNLCKVSSNSTTSPIGNRTRNSLRYWIFGTVTIVLLLLGLWLYGRKTTYFNRVLFNRSSEFAYCTSPSLHANCFFSRSLCYHIKSKTWETSQLPFSNWTEVSLRSRGALFRDQYEHSGCNTPFRPKLRPAPPSSTILWIKGTNVFSCIWFYAFGHIFLEMMLPAWMSMRTLADHLNLFDENVGYVLDDHYGVPSASGAFTLLTKQPILTFSGLVDGAMLKGKENLCFEQLLIGYRLQSSLEFPQNAAHLEVGDLERFRDSIKKLHNIPLKVDMTANKCIALLLQRASSRKIIPDSEKKLVEMLRNRTLCQVHVVSFDGLPVIEQVRLVSKASIFIHVSGSGSHHFIWLADGGASITLVHPHLRLKTIGNGGPGGGGLTLNDFLCWKHPKILCVTAEAKSLLPSYESDVDIDLDSFSSALDMVKLSQKRGHFDPRDQTE